MQDEQKKFQEKLSELLSYARDHENKVTMKEVRDFFEDFALDEQKVTFVCEYLTMEQVDVADYEPGVVPEETEKEKKKPEFSEEELRALQQYLDELPETETPPVPILKWHRLSVLLPDLLCPSSLITF